MLDLPTLKIIKIYFQEKMKHVFCDKSVPNALNAKVNENSYHWAVCL